MTDETKVILVSHYITSKGRKMDAGVIASSFIEAGKAMKIVEDELLEKGWQIDEMRPPPAEPPPPQKSAEREDGDFGTTTCVLIRVAEGYQSSKPQLQFEIEDSEYPLTFTKATPKELLTVLAGATKSNGKPFEVADMSVGKKFAGEWKVRWTTVEKKDGKRYRNVVEVLNG